MDKEKALRNTVEKSIDNISEGAQHAIILCAPAYRNGGNWGMLKKDGNRDYMAKLEALSQEKNNVRVYRVANGCVVQCKESFLADSINAIVPNAINASYRSMKEQRLKEDRERFEKFLQNIGKETKGVKKIAGGYEIVVGIYSANKVNTISLNGHDYPAYKITATEAVNWLGARFGQHAYVKTVKDGRQMFVSPLTIMANADAQVAMYRGLEISDTGTGVFMTIRLK